MGFVFCIYSIFVLEVTMINIKIRITSFIVIALILCLGGMSLFNYFETRRLLVENLESSLAALTLSASSEVGLWLNARKSEIELMAGLPRVQNGDMDAVIAYMNKEISRNKIYEQFVIANNRGNCYMNTGDGGNLADREYFKEVMSTGSTVISDPIISRGSGNQVVMVAAPIKKDGKLLGIIGGSVNLDEFSRMVASVKITKLGYAYSLDKDGFIITHPNQKLLMRYNPLEDSSAHPNLQEAVKRMTQGKTGTTRYIFLGEDKYVSYAPIPGTNWSLCVTVPASYITDQLRYLPIYFIAVMLLFGMAIALLLGRWLAGPLSVLAVITRDITARLPEQIKVAWPKTQIVELDSLVNSFRNMAVVLQEKFQELEAANEILATGIIERKRVEESLKQSYEELGLAYQELGSTEEKLRHNYEELHNKEEALRESEELFRTMSERAPIGIFILQDGKFKFANQQFQQFLGYTEDELLQMYSINIIVPEDRERVGEHAVAALKGKNSLPSEYRFTKKNGEIMWAVETVAPIKYKGKRAILGCHMDINGHKLAVKALRESEIKFRTLFEEALNPIFVFDEKGCYIDANRAGLIFFACGKEELTNRFVNEGYQLNNEAAPSLVPGTLEVQYRVGDILKTILLNIVAVNISGSKTFFGIGQDITGRKVMEEKLMHMSLHDPLTGLYNRTYFEEEMRRLEGDRYAPVGIVVCDVDGLKLVNDTLGHSKGDELLKLTSDIIKKCFRKEDAISRIGGDEFAAVLPKSSLPVVEKAYRRIQEAVANYNMENIEVPLSLSVGFSVSGEKNVSMGDIFKEADNNMYREKLHRKQSTRSAIVQALMKALEVRDFITEGHAERLQSVVASVGETMGLPDSKLVDLRLLAQFHDIGKVGVPDRILFKPGPLTREEYAEMQRHSEIGHRIAQSAPDLVPIADWILKHHEWWNGEGYPLGLTGEEIPLECRILAIADAYDAMTSERPYRKAMGHEEALSELKEKAGIQFDPELVQIVLKILNKS
jgi:diguanylate cyclase (GGDEF)-like protein/PAS domain S-box-containing protein